jgi:hypothetical protein
MKRRTIKKLDTIEAEKQAASTRRDARRQRSGNYQLSDGGVPSPVDDSPYAPRNQPHTPRE